VITGVLIFLAMLVVHQVAQYLEACVRDLVLKDGNWRHLTGPDKTPVTFWWGYVLMVAAGLYFRDEIRGLEHVMMAWL
jgi:hypothetical protein